MTEEKKPRLIIRGDTHGDNASAFSYKQFPEFRELDENDTVIILGDTGIGWPDSEKTTEFVAKNLAMKPFNIIYMFGNHDNYDFAAGLDYSSMASTIYNCPKMKRLSVNGKSYFNQYVVDEPCIADIAGYHCLLIPGADSHDIDSICFPSKKPSYRSRMFREQFYRIIGKTWWPQEAVNTTALYKLLADNEDHFDLVLSHDCPAYFTEIASPHGGGEPRMVPTVGEKYLQALAETLDYDSWFHGHFHYDFFPYHNPSRADHHYDCCCLYHFPYEVEELRDIMDKMWFQKFKQ